MAEAPSPCAADEWRRFEEAVMRFEEAWHAAPHPKLDEFLPATSPLRQRLLLELIAIDQEFRCRRGERPSDAEYRSRYPELAEVSLLDTADNEDAISSAAADWTMTVSSTYARPQLHARGGLGEVLVVDDARLPRRVAIKQLQPRWQTSRRAVRAFWQEVEVTSRLEHPGIVPVHGCGETSDGRPCYSMRFVEGETLGQAIASMHGEADDASGRTIRLRSLLTSFVAVCNTVAYAHSRGVLHRDLKPDNILLGPFGETLVVDWGLAKLLSDQTSRPSCDDNQPGPRTARLPHQADDEPAAQPAHGDRDLDMQATWPVDGDSTPPLEQRTGGWAFASEHCATAVGECVGTPAFMSPEQARGDIAQVGPAMDVFGLGAILYTILTGVPPYQAESGPASIARAVRGDYDPPRRKRPDVPAPLSAVCCRAMAMAPSERYASPLDLARDVENWLAGEPVSAMREPWWDRTRRYLRRRRGLVAALAALAVVLPVIVTVAASLIARERAQSEMARRSAELRRESAQQIASYLTRTFQSADPMPYDDPGFTGNESPSSDAAMRRMLDGGAELLRSHLLDQPEPRSELLVSIGSSYRGLADYDKARAAIGESFQLRRQCFGPDAAETLEAQYHLGRIAYDEGDYRTAERQYREAIAGLEKLTPSRPLLVADVKYHLATLLYHQPLGLDLPQFNRSSVEESIQLFLEVLETRQALLPADDRRIGLAMAGVAAAKQCFTEEYASAALYAANAMEVLRRSDQESLLGNFLIEYARAERLRQQGQLAETDVIYQRLLAEARRLLGPRHPTIVLHLWNMAGLYRKMGAGERAEQVISELRDIVKVLPAVRSSPANVDGLMQYGDALRGVQRDDDARVVFSEALQYAQERPDANAKVIGMLEQRLAEVAGPTPAVGEICSG